MPLLHRFGVLCAALVLFVLSAPFALAADCNSNGIDDDAELADIELPDQPSSLNNSSISGFPTGSFTVEMWVRHTGPAGASAVGIFSYATGGSDNEILLKDFESLQVWVHGTAYNSGLDVDGASNGAWYHLAVAYNAGSGDLAIHRNGVNVRYQAGFLPGAVLNPSGCLYLGEEQDSLCGGFDVNQYFVGNYRQVRVWNSYRSAATVAADYKQALTGAEPGLLAYWPMDEGMGASASDLAGGNDLTLNGNAAWDDYDVDNNGTLDVCQPTFLEVPTDVATIQGAINLIAPDPASVIEVLPGTYVENIDFLGKAVTLRSASGDPSDTIIDAGGVGRVVTMDSGEGPATVVEGFTISHGSSTSGGGMRLSSTSPTVRTCVFSDNFASNGGEIFATGGSPTVEGCVFIGNSASNQGGGILIESGSTMSLTNCVFTDNAASNRGGGMHAGFNAAPTITNCVFAYNTAASTAGGLTNFTAQPVITNTIFWGNTPAQMGNISSSPIVSYCDIQGGLPASTVDGGGNINADPLFIDADGADNTPGTLDDNFRLGAGSPCIDAGDNSAPGLVGPPAITMDLDGVPRFHDNPFVSDTGSGTAPIVDMGPYEDQTPPPTYLEVPTDVATIQGAIDAIVDDPASVIEVLPGTYVENIDFLGKAVTLRSASGDPTDTIIDAGGSGRVVTCESGEGADTVLDGFTITGGNFAAGAGMLNNGSSPTVTNCVFSGNSATGFAGGGGMKNINNGSPTVTDCVFAGNSAASHGGGMDNFNQSSPTITNCVFSGNVATDGGAMWNVSSSNPTVTNCVFSGNSASNDAGGMYNDQSAPMLANCIFWANQPNQISNISVSSTPSIAYCDIQGGLVPFAIDAGGNINADPLFIDADGADNTLGTLDDDLRLAAGSPCIDAGDNGVPGLSGVTEDLDALPRFRNDLFTPDTGAGTAPIVDMGPYEYQPAPVTFITVPTDIATIQGAIDFIADDPASVIEVLPGTYFESIDLLGKSVTLRSASGDPADTIIDGTGAYHVVTCGPGSGANTIEGFTITGGSATGGGSNGSGGGMFVSTVAGTSVSNCVFTGNSAFGGAGLYNDSDGMTVTDCVFRNNAGTNGGGMADVGTSTITGCTFDSNTAIFGAGGLLCSSSETVVTDSTFVANVSGSGGDAVFSSSSDVSLTQCVFNANDTSNALRVSGAANQVVVTSCVFNANGVGVSCLSSASPSFFNTIVWDMVDAGSGSPSFAFCDIQGGVASISGAVDGGGNIDADPLFVDADGADNIAGNDDDDLRLSTGSPCIDAGDNSAPGLTGVDLDGNPRFADDPNTVDTGSGTAPIVDMGPYEVQPPPCPCFGDLDGNCTTDVLDFSVFAANFGQPVAPGTNGDLDGSGFVDVLDFSLFAADFGCSN